MKIYPLIEVIDWADKTGKRIVKIAQHEFNAAIHKLPDAATSANVGDDQVHASSSTPVTDAGEAESPAGLDLSGMDKAALISFANTNSIDISNAKSITDIRKALEAWKEANGVA